VTDLPALNWRKSSYSNNNGGACVEVAETPDGGRLVRDTKDRSLPPHRFTAAEWQAFIKGVKSGEFD
jgi:hypothetical protein